MKLVFLDTAYLFALHVKNDQHHRDADMHWNRLSKHSLQMATTSFIFSEVVTLLNSKSQHASALKIGQLLLQSKSINFIDVDRPLFDAGWEYFRQHHDKTYSLTDCISGFAALV